MGDQTMTPDEHASVAREVLTELMDATAFTNPAMCSKVLEYRDKVYPAPAAPETVTVAGVTWTLSRNGYWTGNGGEIVSHATWSHDFLHRIAADARRIAELERERDEARRALEELKAATRQGEGLGKITEAEQVAAEEPGDARVTVEAAPAPIPLGAVVESVEYAYRFARYTHDWECMQGDPPVGHPVDVEVSALCTALYRALHPVADAATVKWVALRVKQYNGPTAVSAEGFARIILEELGYRIQEREA